MKTSISIVDIEEKPGEVHLKVIVKADDSHLKEIADFLRKEPVKDYDLSPYILMFQPLLKAALKKVAKKGV